MTPVPLTHHRALAFAIAYRMLGSVAEAEDIAQETMARAHRDAGSGTTVAAPKAYISAIATRLAIDQLRSARRRRETYVGPWLPEPLLDEVEPDVAEVAQMQDTLSMAFLVLLEQLSPTERAVFVLREVFAYEYAEIAPIVQKSEDNCRQIFARARRRIDAGRPRFEASRAAQDALAARFLAAAGDGDMAALLELLAADATFTGDGGGKAMAFPAPVVGARRVAAAAVHIAMRAGLAGVQAEPTRLNGQAGLIYRDAGGAIVSAMAIDVADGQVLGIRSVINPDKLGHLGPVSDAARAASG